MTASSDDDQVTIVVPSEVADALNARVDSGEYATPGDVVVTGLRLLTEEDDVLHSPGVERWLRDVAVPIAEATRVDPSRSIAAHDVRAHLAIKHDKQG